MTVRQDRAGARCRRDQIAAFAAALRPARRPKKVASATDMPLA
jgi:hypothetical protein